MHLLYSLVSIIIEHYYFLMNALIIV